MKRFSAVAILLTLCCFLAKAQDPSFAQYYASPLSLNPANTGFFDGAYRVGVNERQQWWNVGYNYNSTSVFADVKLFPERIEEYDVLALGFSAVFENSLNGSLKSNYISVSGAYHKNLGYEGNQTLGMGVQINYTGKYFDYTQLTFASQFNGKIFDPSVPVNAGYTFAKTQYFDINAGLLYALHYEKANFYAGASLYHITRPTETIYDTEGSTVPMRAVGHGGGQIDFNEVSSFLFSGYYMQQGDIYDAMYGGAYGLNLTSNGEKISLYAGLWHRLHSSFIPYLGADYKDISLGMNYGIASNTNYGFTPQTFEVSLIYKFKAKYTHSLSNPIYPRF